MRSTGVKAGLIGGLILIVFNVIGLIPYVGCVLFVLEFLLYAAIGVVAALWMPPRRTPGLAAGQGALAGGIAGLLSGLARVVISAVEVSLAGSAYILSQMPPEMLQQLRDQGVDPSMFTTPAAGAALGSVCCVLGVAIAGGLGALGGAVFAAAKPE